VQSGREDLIGYGPKCLVPPKGGRAEAKAVAKPQERKNVGGVSLAKGPRKEEKTAKKTPRYAKKAKAMKAKKTKG